MEQDISLNDLPPEDGSREVRIHPTAIVEQGAQLGVGVEIGPYCVIGPKVVIGDRVRIESHVTVSGRTTIGRRCAVYPFATLGVIPQDLKFHGEDTELVIGAENSIRNYANISIGTAGGGGKTVIGRRNLLMVYVHVAHDCVIGDNVVLVNGVSLGGHVTVDSRAFIGGHSAVHQFCRVGSYSMTGGGSMVVQDVPPFVMVQGDRATVSGLNVVGLRRSGFNAEQVREMKTMFRLLYNEGLTKDDAMKRIAEEAKDGEHRRMFLAFLAASTRGIVRPESKLDSE